MFKEVKHKLENLYSTQETGACVLADLKKIQNL